MFLIFHGPLSFLLRHGGRTDGQCQSKLKGGKGILESECVAYCQGKGRKREKSSYDTAWAIVSLHRCQVRAAHCRAAPHESRTTVKHRSATTAGLDRDGSSSTLLLAVTTPPSSAEAPADDQEAAVGVWRASCRSLVTLVMILSFFLSIFLCCTFALWRPFLSL